MSPSGSKAETPLKPGWGREENREGRKRGMREKVSLINARNCRSKRLEIVPDFPSTGETKSLGTFDGVIYKVERRKVRSRSY